MSVLSDAKTLFHLAVKPVRGDTHQQRLESFYSNQAKGYDDFRKRLLKGREELYRTIPVLGGESWIDMGGGTGANVEFLADRVSKLRKLTIVDLSTSLLKVARERIELLKWNNVEAVEADATKFVPEEKTVDVITFSYSLTMIPDWCAALEHAYSLLKPGGIIGVVDFYVSPKHAGERTQHSWWTRTFWPTWFAFDNVHLAPHALQWLTRRFTPVTLNECRASVPYVPLGKVPYFTFVGRKEK